MTGQDLSRTCFLCHDPDIFINTDPTLKPYHFVHNPDFKIPTSMPNSGASHISYGQFQHTPTEIESNRWYQLVYPDKKLMNKMIRQFNAAIWITTKTATDTEKCFDVLPFIVKTGFSVTML